MTISLWNERLLAGLAITWGIILLLPGDLFAGIQRYEEAAKYFPDWMWGFFYFLFGVLLLLPFPDRLRRRIAVEEVHKHLHWLLCTVWLGMTILSLLSTFSPPALLIASLCFVVAMFHAGKFWRLGHLPRLMDIALNRGV